VRCAPTRTRLALAVLAAVCTLSVGLPASVAADGGDGIDPPEATPPPVVDPDPTSPGPPRDTESALDPAVASPPPATSQAPESPQPPARYPAPGYYYPPAAEGYDGPGPGEEPADGGVLSQTQGGGGEPSGGEDVGVVSEISGSAFAGGLPPASSGSPGRRAADAVRVSGAPFASALGGGIRWRVVLGLLMVLALPLAALLFVRTHPARFRRPGFSG